MADDKHLAILGRGVDTWNEWRRKNRDIIPDLRMAELNHAKLHAANLSFADLRGTTLWRADLSRADLSNALIGWWDEVAEFELWEQKTDLSEANLSGADLRGADVRHANLKKTNFTEANLYGTVFGWPDLKEAEFSEAKMDATIFGDVDLSQVKGLDTVSHTGPSSIGIHTIYRSKGNIPEVFLRGCGVPETMILYIASLVETPIQFYSAFVSYSSKEQDFVDRLHTDLQGKGVRVWFAPKDVKGGEKLHDQIDRAIRRYDKLLVVLSENSLQSEWVMTEIRRARREEVKEDRRKLFPIRLVSFERLKEWECFDADNGKDMGVEIREYFIPDFSNWQDHEYYKLAFDRLLHDLQAEGEKPKP